MDAGQSGTDIVLSDNLNELIRSKIHSADADLGEALLAVACLAAPTVDLVARGLGLHHDTVAAQLEDAESREIIEINGDQLRFSHPLFARSVYNDAGAGRRRAMHRRLAEVVEEPELHARHHSNAPIILRPSVHNAVLRSCTGELDWAHDQLTSLRKRCIEHGQEGELMLVAFHGVLVEVWRGHFADAALIVDDTLQLAHQLSGDLPLSVALTGHALLTAYSGRVDEARTAIDEARRATLRCGSDRLGEWPATVLGFQEVSLGNYRGALDAIEPLLVKVKAVPKATEIIAASFIPDAVEAMVALDRLDAADELVSALERNGGRLQRDWMLAVGGRGRGMLFAARGDIAAAVVAVEQAMVAHERLPMPFERARTELLLGQLQRRQRYKDASATSLQRALAAFEQLGAPLWADRARTELGRAGVGARRNAAALSPSERRVAELAASGMTNRNIAAAMFISPKTVESNLSRVYAKLDIRSRAELGRRIGQLEE